jgi:hypothetical protein
VVVLNEEKKMIVRYFNLVAALTVATRAPASKKNRARNFASRSCLFRTNPSLAPLVDGHEREERNRRHNHERMIDRRECPSREQERHQLETPRDQRADTDHDEGQPCGFFSNPLSVPRHHVYSV